MFNDKEEQYKYIKENYPDITDCIKDENHWDLFCPECNLVRGFQVVRRGHTTREALYSQSYSVDLTAPMVFYFRCPVCGMYKYWIMHRIPEQYIDKDDNGNERTFTIDKYYKITSLPNDGLQDIEELPEEPKSLRTAYRQAIRAMDANAHIAAAAMFRRALQIITREVIKVNPGNLAKELKETVGVSYNGITLKQDFADMGYIVKEAGNQGAHPDIDPDLLDFTQQDAEDLQKIFMELVSELFVVPEVIKKSKADFLTRRKIK